ncbi:cytochrome P450 3A31 [Trichonephila inaurata madagascariensis]|uniref:Cytochrome P450 3A31 n=1 Tax=Trichonephila inaurata madagascariensis TaxID=2747483 RepID=A0A8X7CQN7_9ARAC|nr:cytochrome P450 3A31 [Trichonephila inaurata madagascariensis]
MIDTEFFFGPLVGAALVLISSVLLYWYSIRNFDYWEKRNVPYVKPFPFVGCVLENMTKPMHEVLIQRHRKYGKVYGHFEGNRAVLSVADTSLLREIFVKDFHMFSERRSMNTGDKIIAKMMSVVNGEDWKRIRTIVTPTFTTGKIRRMVGIFKDCSKTLVENFKTITANGDPVETKKIYGAYTMDVIASACFSTKLDSHNDPENRFVVTARNVFRQSITWRILMFFLFPKLMRLLNITIFPPSALNFFKDATLQIIQERKRTGQTRNDFLQLLMDTAKEVSEDPKSEFNQKDEDDMAAVYGEVDTNHQVFKSVTKKNLSMDELVAQCVIFFIAGYDTTGSTLAFATYMLALNQDVQEKAYQEIVEVLQDTNGELTYEAVQNMKYLDNIISETLRLFPPGIILERLAVADYKLGDTGITIPKGMIVTIPAYAMQRDPENFPNPEKFDPNRFTPEERAKRDLYAYLPFGAGPRNCVGMRFALMEVKICLAYVIANFKIIKSPKTKVFINCFYQ